MPPDNDSHLGAKCSRQLQERPNAELKAVEQEGLLRPRVGAIAGRVPSKPLEQARKRAGAAKTSQLFVYALTKVILENDFGERLVAHKGRVLRGTFAD